MFFLMLEFAKRHGSIFFTLRSSYRIYKRFLELEVAVEHSLTALRSYTQSLFVLHINTFILGN